MDAAQHLPEIITMQNVNKSYKMGANSLHVLKDISLTVEKGEYLAILGPSGSGKSTLMNIIGCMDVMDGGTYNLDGVEIEMAKEKELTNIRNQKIGFIFQKYHLIPTYNVLQNIVMPLLMRGMNLKEAKDASMDTIAMLGLAERIDHKPNELSGGQQQRVAIARALVGQPAILLADESTGGAEKVGLEEIHAYALKDANMGQYESRRGKVYEAVKGSSLADVSSTKAEEKENTAQKPQSTPAGVSKGDIVTFTGGGGYVSSTAEYAAKEKDVVSTCKVTAVNEKGTHKYHCISQDGKGIYGWVNAESIKELSSKAHSDPTGVSKGDIVTFTGGGVYKSSTADHASVEKDVVSTCKVTAINTKGTHPYHCISQDGKGVYGWVNKEDVK